MIYQFVLFAMGPHGRWLLDFIAEHQLMIMSVIFVLLFIEMLNNHSKNKKEVV
jgi:hypothetical protein